MTTKRRFPLIIALLVAGSLVASTTGFGSAAVDRNVDVAIVSDDEAYLGVQRECHNSTLQVTVTNRFAAEATLNVAIVVNGTTKTIDGLRSGESQSKAFDTFATDDTISIRASSSEVSVRVARSPPAEC